MTELDALLAGIVADPLEETRWLVLADWLEENDDPRRAELLRLHRKMLATCCDPDAHPERAAWQVRMVELLVAGVRPCVPQETLLLPGGVPMTFSFIPPGAFLMGSAKGAEDEQTVHRVELAHGFFMGVYPVTQAQWFAMMETSPSAFKGELQPVDSVSWNSCQDFCRRVSERTNRTVQLGTEVEWELACRAGTTTAYHFGDVVIPDLINCDARPAEARHQKSKGDDKFPARTTLAGSYPPNPWGLYDMHGNVWEWCADRADSDEDRPSYMMRGGCWNALPGICTSLSRVATAANSEGYYDGFRACLRLETESRP